MYIYEYLIPTFSCVWYTAIHFFGFHSDFIPGNPEIPGFPEKWFFIESYAFFWTNNFSNWIGLDWIYRDGSETNPNRFCQARELKDLTTAQKSHEHYSLPLYSNRTTSRIYPYQAKASLQTTGWGEPKLLYFIVSFQGLFQELTFIQ